MLDPTGRVPKHHQPQSVNELTSFDLASILDDKRVVFDISSRERGRDQHNMLISQQLWAVSSTVKAKVEPETLAKRWGIGLEAAKNTLKVTTNRAIRTVLHPALSRRFRTNDRSLRYRRLPMYLFTDTLITKVTSRRGNKHAQIFGAAIGWKRVFPIKTKGEAHEALSLLLQRDGAPPN